MLKSTFCLNEYEFQNPRDLVYIPLRARNVCQLVPKRGDISPQYFQKYHVMQFILDIVNCVTARNEGACLIMRLGRPDICHARKLLTT